MVEAVVSHFDLFENAIAGANITYAQALAGYQQSHQVDLYNSSTYYLNNVRAWIDQSVQYIEISDDDASWVSHAGVGGILPASYLDLGDIACGADTPLYIRRTIPAGTGAAAKVMVKIHFYFSGPLV